MTPDRHVSVEQETWLWRGWCMVVWKGWWGTDFFISMESIKIVKSFYEPPFSVTTRANFTGVNAAPVVKV